ncbi:MAG: hypothetical protein HY435_02515 [Candidatus Liptonbacteria bacterium]|nr:hypothetical protein [Candidatus Liptonbacteria bacterium]
MKGGTPSEPVRHEEPYNTKQRPTTAYAAYLTIREVLAYGNCPCWYLRWHNTPSNIDGDGEVWSGILHEAGIFPGLGESESGFIKTVMRVEGKKYRIIYIKKEELTLNYTNTEWYAWYGNYDAIDPQVPQLCPRPSLGLLARLRIP